MIEDFVGLTLGLHEASDSTLRVVPGLSTEVSGGAPVSLRFFFLLRLLSCSLLFYLV